MRFKATFVLALILAIIIAYIYFIDIPGKKREEELKEKEKMILPFEADELKGFTLVNNEKAPGEKITLKKDPSGKWKMVEPINARADEEVVGKIIETLKDFTFNRVVSEEAHDLSVYGLDKPKLKIEVELESKGQKRKESLLVGDMTPAGSDIYVKRGEERRILSVYTQFKDPLNKDLESLRDKRIFPFVGEEVKKIDLIYPGEVISLEKEKGQWQIKSPTKLKADNTALSGFLFILGNLITKKFIENGEQYGFESPQFKIILNGGEKELIVGKEEKDLVYAKNSWENFVYATEKRHLQDLKKGVFDLRDKKILHFNFPQIKRIVINFGGKDHSLKKEKNQWMIDQPSKKELKEDEVNIFLSDLANLEAKEFLEDYPLKTSKLAVSIYDQEEKIISSIQLGEEFKEKDAIYIRNEKDGRMYLVNRILIQELEEDLKNLLK